MRPVATTSSPFSGCTDRPRSADFQITASSFASSSLRERYTCPAEERLHSVISPRTRTRAKRLRSVAWMAPAISETLYSGMLLATVAGLSMPAAYATPPADGTRG